MTLRAYAFTLACTAFLFSALGAAPTAETILRETGVRGGIIVHLGCGDGKLTAALRADDGALVHGLATDAAQVAAARAHIQEKGLYGVVSVEQLTSKRLPYADNLVNLVVVEDATIVPASEVMRVLAPGGVAYSKEGAGWKRSVKPVPSDIDEWAHYLHDAGNNAVAKDTVVGAPRRLQWLAPPLWLRSHETASGIQSQVAAGGRLFYVFDEGLIGITDERFPARWSILCRDAFNGKLLWKRPMPEWGWREWKKTSFEGKDWLKLRAARTSAPSQVQRRLVAGKDRLYATLGYRGPVAILDAATGKTLKTVEGAKPAYEILLSDGIVVAHVREEPSKTSERRGKAPAGGSVLVGVTADTGDVLWRTPTGGNVRDLFVAVDDGRVFAAPGKSLLCLDLKTGKQLWRSTIKSGGARTMVASTGSVVILGGTTLDCYDAKTGALRWNRKTPARSGFENVDLFVIDGRVWPGMVPVKEDLKPTGKSEHALGIGYDIQTGKEAKRVLVKKFRSPEHHHRCYRNKATSRYIISGMEGAEFMDLQGAGHSQNNFVRGACKLGIMPSYGMLYVPSDQCFCQPGGKLLGYAAIGPAATSAEPVVPDAARLEKGPAYGKAGSKPVGPTDWATYRHGPARHGATSAAVPAALKPGWRVKIGARVSQPVAAYGKVFVAAIDAHTIHALDAASGKEAWRFIAGGRIDSPPTLHDGLVLFGSAAGRVTCLRESDGAVVWRFLAAPYDRRIACFDQLESVWPVSGSVLMRDGVAYVAAGRSTYLDGGVRFYGLDPKTGRILHKGLIEGPHRTVDKDRDLAFFIEGANADVLVSEGDAIYMRQKKLTPTLQEVKPTFLSSKGEADVGLHMFSTSGMLDDSWYNRAFWMYSKRWPGFQLANQAPKTGQLLVADDTTTYALRVYYHRNVHSPMFFPGKKGYLLFADKNTTEPQIVGEAGARPPLRWLPQSDYSRARGNQVAKLDSKAFGLDKMIGYTRADPPLWTLWLPVRVRAMVKTRDVLFVAGPPDVYDADAPHAAFEGKRGASLVAVSPKEGKKLGEMKLDVPPVFDGMIAIDGRLIVTLRDGSVLSMAP